MAISTTLLSIVESAAHPNFTGTYKQLCIVETKLNSMRKALATLKKQPFDYIVAEFFYGYGSNYAGVNISNLDVMLYSLQKYSPDTRVIVLVDKTEREYVDKLNEIFPIHAVLQYPVSEADIKQLLSVV
jgi:NADH:ubiquinone oxidoreductase subunit C